ncbi:hypothetical protein HZB88_04875 [archaeon]|nr:hypothetical protein [archaeon]
MEDIEEALIQIGLTKNEAKIFFVCLQEGLCSAGIIAKKCGLHRTNVYDAIERLIEKGLLSYIIKDNTKLFEPTSPQNLFYLINEREARLRSIMPRLELARRFSQKKGEAHIYEGISAFLQLRFGLLRHNKEILVYGVPKIASEMVAAKLNHFHRERIRLKIQMKHIYNHDAQERIAYLNRLPLTQARFLPQKYQSLVSTCICNNETVLTVWTNPPLMLQIINEQIAEAYRKFFYLLWKNARRGGQEV